MSDRVPTEDKVRLLLTDIKPLKTSTQDYLLLVYDKLGIDFGQTKDKAEEYKNYNNKVWEMVPDYAAKELVKDEEFNSKSCEIISPTKICFLLGSGNSGYVPRDLESDDPFFVSFQKSEKKYLSNLHPESEELPPLVAILYHKGDGGMDCGYGYPWLKAWAVLLRSIDSSAALPKNPNYFIRSDGVRELNVKGLVPSMLPQKDAADKDSAKTQDALTHV
jgi:hypothetical protein